MPIVLNIRVLPFLFEVSMVLHEVKRHRTVMDRLMCLVAVVEETCVACIVCETFVKYVMKKWLVMFSML